MYRQGNTLKAGRQSPTQAHFPPVYLLRTSALILSPPPAAAKKPAHQKDKSLIDITTPASPESLHLRQSLQHMNRLGELSPLSRVLSQRARHVPDASTLSPSCSLSASGPALESSQPPPPLSDDQGLAQAHVVDAETLMCYDWHQTESGDFIPSPISCHASRPPLSLSHCDGT